MQYSLIEGQSSNIAFTRNLRRAFGSVFTNGRHESSPAPRTAEPTPSPPHPSLQVSRPQSPRLQSLGPRIGSNTDNNISHLPPIPEVEALVVKFFNTTGVLFPYVHQASFMKTFEQARQSGFRTFRRSWLGLMNIMLAMATMTETHEPAGTSERTVRAENFFTRSKALCFDLIMSGASVETGELEVAF